MTKIKTSDLTGAALDWAVAKAEGHTPLYTNAPHANLRNKLGNIWHLDELTFSTDWAHGGPIIEREKLLICAWGKDQWKAESYWNEGFKTFVHVAMFSNLGPTPLVAAMRCFVASKLGDNIDTPKELS